MIVCSLPQIPKAIQYTIQGACFQSKHLAFLCLYIIHLYLEFCYLSFVLRTSSTQRLVTGEEAHESDEESEYMIPSSRPVLPPITAPPAGETPSVLRPPLPLAALQTQTQATALNLRYSRHSMNSLPAAFLNYFKRLMDVVLLLLFVVVG